MLLSRARRRVRRLLAFPGQGVGLLALTSVLVAVSVSAPLFIGAAGERAWGQDRARLSTTVLGGTLMTVASPNATAGGEGDPRVRRMDRLVRREARAAGLSAPLVLTRLTETVTATGRKGTAGVRVISRTGAADAVELVDDVVETDGPGVLVPRPVARALGLKPGRTMELSTLRGSSVRLPVAGIYKDPRAPLDTYWQGLEFLYLPQPSPSDGEPVEPPPVLIITQQHSVDVALDLELPMFVEWFFPLPEELGRDESATVAQGYERLALRTNAPGVPVAALMAEVADYPQLRTALPQVLESVDETVDLLAPPVRAVGQGGAAAGLLLIGAWAAWRVRRRETELRALVARGLSPAQAGRRVLAEALVPVLVGTAVGIAVGVELVRRLAPVPPPPGSLADTLPLLAGAVVATLAAVVAVTVVLTARMGQVGRGPAEQLLSRVPWLAVTMTVAVIAVVPLVTGRSDTESETGVGLLTLAVPLLVVVAGTGVVIGLLQRLAPRLRSRLGRLPVSSFLGVRRVLGAPTTTRLVVVSTALTLGLVVYAGALVESTARTVEAKAVVAVGSDVVVQLHRAQKAPPLPSFATAVQTDTDVMLLPGDVHADVLAVDTSRFTSVAFWNDDLADRSLEQLMAALRDQRGERVPVVVAGSLPGAVLEADAGKVTVDSGQYEVPAEVVGRAAAFPGMSSLRPLLVVDRSRLTAALAAVDRDADSVLAAQVWARGDVERSLVTLAEAGLGDITDEQVQTAADFAARPALRAQTWTLDYLRAVAGAAALLGLVGLGLHAAGQHRRRTVAAVLLARMGLSRRSARSAAAVELGLLALLAGLLGVAFALPTSRLVLERLDPVPGLPPDPLFELPGATLAGVAGAVVVVSVVGAVIVDLLTRRSPGGQVLRDDS